MKHNKYPSSHTGFTLVEMSIVLVIIGLILGMAFKGKDLIDGAKVKSAEANINKVVSAINTYYERYAAYPGDGCTATTLPVLGTSNTVCTGTRNGVLDSTEAGVATIQLQNAKLLSNSDLRSPFGTNWVIAQGGSGGTASNYAYLTVGSLSTASADERLVCAIDQQFDDGVGSTGVVRSSGGTTPAYTATSDCWSLLGLSTVAIQVLP